jgi:serine acetyltransferase
MVYLFDLRSWLLWYYRVMVYLKGTYFSFFKNLLSSLGLQLYSSEISPNAKIGCRLKFAHPLGVVIGDDCTI